MLFLLILGGFILLIVGAELLVRGASRLARAVGLPSLIIGLTVVAFGTSAPELAVSLKAGVSGQADIALGNVVGSNTFNVLFILGVSALIAPLATSSQLVRLDVPIMIGVSGLTWGMASSGAIGRIEGVLLTLGIVVYTIALILKGWKSPAPESSTPPAAEEPAPVGRNRLLMAAIQIVIGLAMLVLGARWLVEGAVDLARQLGVSELLIALTIVSAGTSLPEVATSVMASIRGERDIAVGNVVGSNIFNILAVLGITAVVSPNGVGVAPAALHFDIPVMTAVAVVCLPVFFTGSRISRREGALLLGYYAAYVTFLVLASTGHPSLGNFRTAMIWFVIPLSLIGIGFSVAMGLRKKKPTLPQGS